MIDQDCDGCLRRFEVVDSLAGGVVNCPGCGALQDVKKADAVDATLFWGGLVAFTLVGVFVGLGVGLASSWVTGGTIIGLSLVIALIVGLSS